MTVASSALPTADMTAATLPAESPLAFDARHELPTPASHRNAPPLTVIADGTTVGGSVTVTGDLRVDGAVEGELLAAGGLCEIGPQGAVRIDLARAVSVVVHGRVDAREIVARRVTVMRGGELHARLVVAEAVDVEEGGKLAADLDVGRGRAA